MLEPEGLEQSVEGGGKKVEESVRRVKSADLKMHPFVMLLVAMPGWGKTNFIQNLITEHLKSGNWDYVMVYSPNAFNGDYDFLPEQFRSVAAFDEKERDKIEELQLKNTGAHLGLILDDAIGNMNWDKDKMKIFLMGFRHRGVSVVVGAQFINRISTTFRNVCTDLLLGGIVAETGRLKLFNELASRYYGSKEEFYAALDQLEKPQFLYLNLLDLTQGAEIKVAPKFNPKIKIQFKSKKKEGKTESSKKKFFVGKEEEKMEK